MRLIPRRILGRLVLGLVMTSLAAISISVFYIYTRFHWTHQFFYEGTLQSYLGQVLQGVRSENGVISVHVPKEIFDRIAERKGRFIVLDEKGRKLAGSPELERGFVTQEDVSYRYFWEPAVGNQPELYGLSGRIPALEPAAYIQIAFPRGHIIFESVLHEFMKDIAWLWVPFLALLLLTNIVIAHFAMRPLAQAVEEARAIQPGGVMVFLSEKNLPDDLLSLVRTVNEAFGRLREAYRSQEEFVADMAHELRTPLAVMKAQLTALPASAAYPLSRDVETMARLVEQLLDRARLGRFHIEPGDLVDLVGATREAAAFLAPRILARHREIEVVAPEHPVIVAGVYDDLFRAIRNLVENALEHAPEASMISVTVTTDRVVTVRDHGPGFPTHVLDAEQRRRGYLRSDRREGAGLGLSIVERTMTAHGGLLKLDNDIEGGGKAVMAFPAHEFRPLAAEFAG